jgi:hypothetical protein
MTDHNSSYVDDYLPPQGNTPQNDASNQTNQWGSPALSSAPTPTPAPWSTPAPQAPAAVVKPEPVTTPEPIKPADSPAVSQASSQTLEDQNIFHLLGVEDATEDEKESFLDELQQVIWEDFLENDVDLLLTSEEMVEFKKIEQKKELSEEDRQGEMVEYLEKLVPDLEKIMLEKALELKEEMMRERIAQLTTQYKELPDKLSKVQEAQRLVDDQKWRSAADTLNAIPA